MKNSNPNSLIRCNLALWFVAALLYPLAHWIPTGSGAPPKIFEVLVPLITILFGLASTSFLQGALKRSGRDE